MFATFLGYLLDLVFYVPITILSLLGAILPACSDMGFSALTASFLNTLAQWVRVAWPVIQFLPVDTIFDVASAYILYFVFKWLWKFWPKLFELGARFWVIVAIIYIILFSVDWLIGDGWTEDDWFTDAFGESPSSTFSGGGGGGGGGGSW